MVTPDRDKAHAEPVGEGGGAGRGEPATAPVEAERVVEPRPEQAAGPGQPAPQQAGQRTPQKPGGRIKRTRFSAAWAAVIVAAVVLIFLLIFILQNLDSVTVRFLGAAGTLPIGVGLLFAAIAGALLVFLVGTARIVQLRRVARKAQAAHRR